MELRKIYIQQKYKVQTKFYLKLELFHFKENLYILFFSYNINQIKLYKNFILNLLTLNILQ